MTLMEIKINVFIFFKNSVQVKRMRRKRYSLKKRYVDGQMGIHLEPLHLDLLASQVIVK